jgi:hypothetical protein
MYCPSLLTSLSMGPAEHAEEGRWLGRGWARRWKGLLIVILGMLSNFEEPLEGLLRGLALELLEGEGLPEHLADIVHVDQGEEELLEVQQLLVVLAVVEGQDGQAVVQVEAEGVD